MITRTDVTLANEQAARTWAHAALTAHLTDLVGASEARAALTGRWIARGTSGSLHIQRCDQASESARHQDLVTALLREGPGAHVHSCLGAGAALSARWGGEHDRVTSICRHGADLHAARADLDAGEEIYLARTLEELVGDYEIPEVSLLREQCEAALRRVIRPASASQIAAICASDRYSSPMWDHLLAGGPLGRHPQEGAWGVVSAAWVTHAEVLTHWAPHSARSEHGVVVAVVASEADELQSMLRVNGVSAASCVVPAGSQGTLTAEVLGLVAEQHDSVIAARGVRRPPSAMRADALAEALEATRCALQEV